MKYNMKQRLNMAYHGVDADELENPKQKLPPLEKRIEKLQRLLDNPPKNRSKERMQHYKEQLEVYRTLQHPEQKQKRGIWQSLWGGK